MGNERRLALIREKARQKAPKGLAKPVGIHRVKNPVPRPRRQPPWASYVLREREGGTRMPPRFGGFSTFEIPNHYYFEDYLPKKKKELGERHGKKGPTALTKIAHAKQVKLKRVPPWQKQR